MVNKKNIYVEITVTNNCNCNCQYCFEGQHPLQKRNLLEEERQLQLILNTCNNFDKHTTESFTISFWGGEPMLNTDFMYKVIRSTVKFNFVRYHIYSNGTLFHKFEDLINQDFFAQLKNRLHIQLSYDGEPQHSLKRGYSHEAIFKTMRLLLDNNVIVFFKSTLTFDMIPHMAEIWESFFEAYQEFGNCVSYSPTLDTETTDVSYLDEWKSQLRKIAKKEYYFIKEHNRPLMSWFTQQAKKNCMLGNSCHIHNDGNIYICHGCPYSKDKDKFILGNTKSINSISDVLFDKVDLDFIPEKCKNCVSTYCAVCHISQLGSSRNIYEDWIPSKVNNINRCKFFQEFGRISRLLELKLTGI